jgi:hypothetical protein
MTPSNNFARLAAKSALLVLLIILAYLYYGRNQNYSVDDSFITYRYAFHLMQGDGLKFNIDEKYYGTTAAGYAIMLSAADAAAHTFSSLLTTQNVSVALSTIALIIISACAYLIAESRKVGSILALIASTTFAFALFVGRPFNEVAGHETYAFLAGALLGTFLASRNKMLASGITIAVTSTFRPDAILFAPVICCVYVYCRNISLRDIFRERHLYLFAGGLFLVILPWLAFLQYYFGRPFPGTMDAKRAQILMGYWPTYNIENLSKYVTDSLNISTSSILTIGVICFFFSLIRSLISSDKAHRSDPALFIGVSWLIFMLGSVLSYFTFNVTFWHWYGIPVVFALMIISYSGAISLLPTLEKPANALAIIVALSTITCSILLTTNHAQLTYWATNKNVNPHITAYFETADYIKSIEPEGTTIEMAEPGSFGMRLGSKFRVIDELGLVTPNVAKAYLQGDGNYVNREYAAKYIVCSWAGSYSACSKPEVMENYTLIGEFDKAFWTQFIGHGAMLYRRN